MKKILILGAAGQISRLLTTRLLAETDWQLVLYGRSLTTRLADLANEARVQIVEGDFQNQAQLAKAMDGVDLAYLNSMSNPDDTASVIAALKQAGVKRVIGATIAGIENEVPQALASWTEANLPASYIAGEKASAKLLANSGLDYLLLRLTWLYDDPSKKNYELVPSGQTFVDAEVSRDAVVQAILDILSGQKPWQASYGVGEPGTAYEHPSFY